MVTAAALEPSLWRGRVCRVKTSINPIKKSKRLCTICVGNMTEFEGEVENTPKGTFTSIFRVYRSLDLILDP